MINDKLREVVKQHELNGCFCVNRRLGKQEMPPGYAIMLNADRTHFYWLRFDGVESVISCDKWGTYLGARKDYVMRNKNCL